MTCTCGQAPAGKSGLCRHCSLVLFGKKNLKYPWTPEMDDLLTQVYRTAINKTDLSTALTITAKRLRRPRYIIQNRAQFLGLRIREQKLWTAEETRFLEEASGAFSIAAMAKKLGRTTHAVKHKMFMLRMSSKVIEGFSQNEIAGYLGVHHNKVSRWIGRGWLTQREDDRVTQESVERFVWDHMDEYRLRACEEWWLKAMLKGGRNRTAKKQPQPEDLRRAA